LAADKIKRPSGKVKQSWWKKKSISFGKTKVGVKTNKFINKTPIFLHTFLHTIPPVIH
jgi:hypothetical protein